MNTKNIKICVVGLGYVGLPLAYEFSKKFPVIGFDINKDRISELKDKNDSTLEISSSQLSNSLVNSHELLSNNNGLYITNNVKEIESSNFYIITVPTPIDKYKRPLLSPLLNASKTVGSILFSCSRIYGTFINYTIPFFED